uniref:Ribosomal protein eL8/eL30/eS12/Gadd45 domain-containing protein n=1 Tax=Eucampia antarctica TaxID=49252 RepID=A0A7S2S0F1_9STRA
MNHAIEEINGMVIGGQQVIAYPKHKNNNNSSCVMQDKNMDGSQSTDEPQLPPPMYSGEKIIPEKYAACKRVPKIPNKGIPRDYASTRIDDENVVPLICEMLGELMRLQIRNKDDKNARARRRLVMGFREVARGIRSHKIKMIIMANNLDEYGAIDSKLQDILDMAKEDNLPVIFEMNKRKIGKALGKTIKVGIVGIQNADGAHEPFKKLKKLMGAY